MAYLKAQNGSLAGQRFELDEGESVLGRSPECSIHVEDFAVSRQHAKVHNNEGEFFIEDLKSRNKTYLNDVVLGEGQHQLRNGDRLSICDVIFNFYQEFATGLSDSLDGSQISVLFDGAETATSTIMSKLEIGAGHGQIQITASPEV